jgi:hypothetical protein
MNSNELDSFEHKLKESLQGYEVPYNSAHWTQMDRALSSGVKGWSHGRTILVGALLAGALLVGGAAYYMGLDSGKQEMTGPQPAQLTSVENTPTQAAPTQTGMEPVSTEATIQQEGASRPTAVTEEGAQLATATSATSAPLKGKNNKAGSWANNAPDSAQVQCAFSIPVCPRRVPAAQWISPWRTFRRTAFSYGTSETVTSAINRTLNTASPSLAHTR